MTIDHLSEFLVGFESLPLQARAPVFEETARPTFTLIVPELAERFLEQVGRVQALVGRQQGFERLFALQGEVLATREQRVLLAFDVAAVLAAESRVFTFSHLVERFAQMMHDVELVKENRCLRRSREGRVTERLPHVHHRQANASAFLRTQPFIELRHARLRSVLAAEPDRPTENGPRPATQVAHHDARDMPRFLAITKRQMGIESVAG